MNEITKAEIRKRLGNITQLQELLLGDKIDEYNYKLQSYQLKIDALAAKLEDVLTVTDEHLARLESKLISRIEAVANTLEKKQNYYQMQTQAEQHKLQQELGTVSEYSQENIDFLRQKINTNTNNLKLEISQSKSDLDRDLSIFKQQIISQLEDNIHRLSTNKISRADLAEVLFDLCLKLKETDKNLDYSSSEIKYNSKHNTDLVDS